MLEKHNIDVTRISLNHPVLSFYRSGFLLHVIALSDLIITTILVYLYVNGASDWNFFWKFITLYGIVVFLSMAIFAQLDAYSRFQNYKQIKDQIIENGFQLRILKPMHKSRCQRDAAIVAAAELGLEEEARAYYKTFGYKWYHIIPDFVFRQPLYFFSVYFWRTTFFTPYYKPKFDFKQLNYAQQ